MQSSHAGQARSQPWVKRYSRAGYCTAKLGVVQLCRWASRLPLYASKQSCILHLPQMYTYGMKRSSFMSSFSWRRVSQLSCSNRCCRASMSNWMPSLPRCCSGLRLVRSKCRCRAAILQHSAGLTAKVHTSAAPVLAGHGRGHRRAAILQCAQASHCCSS